MRPKSQRTFWSRTDLRNMLALPAKKDHQSLHGYIRAHLHRLERELLAGVPYQALTDALTDAVSGAGFEKAPLRSIRTAVYRARRDRSACAAERTPAADRSSLGPSPSGMRPPLTSAKDETASIARRFRELVRVVGADERDPLI